MNTEEMTLEQLRTLKRQNYKNAINDGTLEFLSDIARHLGERQSSNYGPKYKWEHDNIEIFVDDYGNFMTVTVEGEQVASTHPCGQYIRGGGWLDEVKAFKKELEIVLAQKELDWVKKEREKLLKMI